MPADKLLFVYLILVLGSITALAIYSEVRRRRFRAEPTEDHIFRCQKCSFVYTDDADVDRSRCPQCSQQNDAFKF